MRNFLNNMLSTTIHFKLNCITQHGGKADLVMEKKCSWVILVKLIKIKYLRVLWTRQKQDKPSFSLTLFLASFPQSCLLAFFSTASSWSEITTKSGQHHHDERGHWWWAVDDGLLSLYNSSFHQSLHKLSVITVTHFVDILIKKWHSLGFEPTYFCSAARTTAKVPD